MVQAPLRRRSDVHARAFAYRLEAFENLNLPGVVLVARAVVAVPFRHELPLKSSPYKSRKSGRNHPVEINRFACGTQRFAIGSSFCGSTAYGWPNIHQIGRASCRERVSLSDSAQLA